MDTITLSYRGQTVALAARARFWLAAHIEALPAGHPDRRHVCFMALYARDVLTGDLPGPDSDDNANRFARLAVVPKHVVHPGLLGGWWLRSPSRLRAKLGTSYVVNVWGVGYCLLPRPAVRDDAA